MDWKQGRSTREEGTRGLHSIFKTPVSFDFGFQSSSVHLSQKAVPDSGDKCLLQCDVLAMFTGINAVIQESTLIQRKLHQVNYQWENLNRNSIKEISDPADGLCLLTFSQVHSDRGRRGSNGNASSSAVQ